MSIFEENLIIKMFFKKYQFLLEKLLKRKFLKKFENFIRKNSDYAWCLQIWKVWKKSEIL